MNQKSEPASVSAEQVAKNIRRPTQRHLFADDKIRIVLEGSRGEARITAFGRREVGVQYLCCLRLGELLEADKKRLAATTTPPTGERWRRGSVCRF